MPDRSSLFFPPLPEALTARLAPHLASFDTPGDGPFQGITLEGTALTASLLGISAREAMIFCLERNIWPLRFKNNRGWLEAQEQIRLLQSHVAVIGCGGLGGHALTLLARIGVGELTVCDHDLFEESNLNRQRLCREDRLGMNKALAAGEELALVASHAVVHALPEEADAANLPGLLNGVHVVVDCLDSIPARTMLEQAAHALAIPFVHGAIAGLEGFVTASRANDGSAMERLYPDTDEAQRSAAELKLGVPGPTPAVTAVLQTMLVIRLLLGRDTPTPAMLWHLDLAVPELELLCLF